ADGSMIFLNRNTELQYPNQFAKDKRIINLIGGEAFFKVSPDKSKPFIVNIRDVRVTVIGTSFNIRVNENKTELIVESGIVEVQNKDIIIRLKRNEMVSIDKETGQFNK